jgi:hypothetical protein
MVRLSSPSAKESSISYNLTNHVVATLPPNRLVVITRSPPDHHPIISRKSGDDRELAAANTAGTDALPSGGGGTTRKEKDEHATAGAATGDASEATLALSESEHKAAKALQGKRSRGRPPPGTGMAWRA